MTCPRILGSFSISLISFLDCLLHFALNHGVLLFALSFCLSRNFLILLWQHGNTDWLGNLLGGLLVKVLSQLSLNFRSGLWLVPGNDLDLDGLTWGEMWVTLCGLLGECILYLLLLWGLLRLLMMLVVMSLVVAVAASVMLLGVRDWTFVIVIIIGLVFVSFLVVAMVFLSECGWGFSFGLVTAIVFIVVIVISTFIVFVTVHLFRAFLVISIAKRTIVIIGFSSIILLSLLVLGFVILGLVILRLTIQNGVFLGEGDLSFFFGWFLFFWLVRLVDLARCFEIR